MLKYPILYFALLISGGLYGQEQIKVMVMEIKSTIDPRTTRYVNMALEHADKINAELIILEIGTYGGTVNDAKDIVEFFLDLAIPF